MSRSVIVFAMDLPKAVEQSRHLRQHFGLDRVITDWNGRDAYPGTGALILTNNPDPRIAARGNYFTLQQAMQKAGEVFA